MEALAQVKQVDLKTGVEILALGNPKKLNGPFVAQGDCLIKKCGTKDVFAKEFGAIPKDAIEKKTNLVLKGQQNSHAIYFGDFNIYEHDKVTFLKVNEPCIIDHVKDHNAQVRAEHHAIWIPVGEYFIDQLNEFDHLAEESRKIQD